MRDHLWAAFSSLLFFFKANRTTYRWYHCTLAACHQTADSLIATAEYFLEGKHFYKIREDHQKLWASKNLCILLLDLTRGFKMGLHNDPVQDTEAGGMNKSTSWFGCYPRNPQSRKRPKTAAWGTPGEYKEDMWEGITGVTNEDGAKNHKGGKGTKTRK